MQCLMLLSVLLMKCAELDTRSWDELEADYYKNCSISFKLSSGCFDNNEISANYNYFSDTQYDLGKITEILSVPKTMHEIIKNQINLMVDASENLEQQWTIVKVFIWDIRYETGPLNKPYKKEYTIKVPINILYTKLIGSVELPFKKQFFNDCVNGSEQTKAIYGFAKQLYNANGCYSRTFRIQIKLTTLTEQPDPSDDLLSACLF